jgi:hypothetical protein
MLARLTILVLSWLAVSVQGAGPWEAQWQHLRLRFLEERSSDPVNIASVTATTSAFVDTVIVENHRPVPLESLGLDVLSRPDGRRAFAVSATRTVDVHIGPNDRAAIPVGLLPAGTPVPGVNASQPMEVVVCPVQVRYAGGDTLDLSCTGVEDRLEPLQPLVFTGGGNGE